MIEASIAEKESKIKSGVIAVYQAVRDFPVSAELIAVFDSEEEAKKWWDEKHKKEPLFWHKHRWFWRRSFGRAISWPRAVKVKTKAKKGITSYNFIWEEDFMEASKALSIPWSRYAKEIIC